MSRPFPLCTGLLLCLFAAAAPGAAPDGEPARAREQTPRFDIWEFEVAGSSIIPDTEVEAAVYPFLGEGKTIDDVERARAALEKTFRDAGYGTTLVSIPEQPVASGVVRIEVTEARVERLRVVGAKYYSPERIAEETPSLAEGVVPHFPSVQQDLARINRLPGRRVTPVLRPGSSPGTTAVDLMVEDRPPWGGSVELNNNRSPDTEPLRLTASLRFDNLFQRQHGASLQYQVAPQDPSQVNALSASYYVPLKRPGEFLSFSATRSRSDVAVLDSTTALGDGDILGARWTVPLPGSDRLYHALTLGIDYKNFKENLIIPGLDPVQSPVSYWPASIAYSGGMSDAGGEWSFGAGLAAGLRGLGDDDAAFDNKRFAARSNFLALRWDLAREQSLGSWGRLLVSADGQVADQALISNEQFSAGGAGSVRGYLQSEALGDSGIRGTVEYRAPSLSGEWAPQIDELVPYVFYDAAWLARKDPLPGERDRSVISSAGLGLQLRAFRVWSLALNLAVPLKDHPVDVAQPRTRAHHARVLFNTRVDF